MRVVRGGVGIDDALQGRAKVWTWGLTLAKRSRHRKATVAVACKLAVIMRHLDGRNLLRRQRGGQRR